MKRLRTNRLPTRSGVAVGILITGLTFTAVASLFAYRAYDANETRRFSEASNEVQDSLQTRARGFETLLLQMAGLYALAPNMTIDDFHAYASNAQLPRNDRGVYTFGIFARANDKAGAEKMLILVHEVNANVPYKTAKPGADVSGDPERMATIAHAAETARPALSGLINGLSSTSAAGRGYMLVAPAYRGVKIPETVEERRNNLLGVSYLRFSESGIFDIYQSASPKQSSVDMQVYAGELKNQDFSTGRLMLDRFPDVSYAGSRKSDFEVRIGDVPFTVRLFAVSRIESYFGIVFSALLLATGTFLSLLCYRTLRRREARDHRLLQSERQLRLVTDSLPAMIAYIDRTGVYRLNNKTYETFFGVTREQITGRPVREVVGEKNFSVMEWSIQRALAGETVSADWSIETPRGRTRLFQISLLPDVNSEGTVKGVISMWNDITDRQKAQERARFLGEFSTVLAASLDPIKTSEKIATLLTPSLAQWCAIDLLQPDGTLARIATHGELAEGAQALKHDQSMASAAIASKKTEISDAEDSRHSSISIPLRSADQALGAITLASPKLVHRFLDEDVQFAIEVSLRASLAIENARLYSESQSLNRAKDNFLAMLSHELRTPMNVILGWLEILSTEDVDKETYAQALDTLNRNARVQIQLINELLDVSRIINGKLTVHPKFCDIGEIAEGALESVKPAARAKQIECRLTTSGDLEMLADPERIQQILWNLLSNALKFTPASGKVDVHVEGFEDEIHLSVTDTGLGIDPSFLPFVFDRFRQEESTFARQQGGLGLGLSIVRYLAEAHGGSIAVDSEGKDKGASFTLVLPRSGTTEPSRLENYQAEKA